MIKILSDDEAVQVECLDMLPRTANVSEYIAAGAWVSTNKGTNRTTAEAKQLVSNLIRRGHNVPLEQVVFRLRIKAPVFLLNELRTHRHQSPVLSSARYGVVLNELWTTGNPELDALMIMYIEESNRLKDSNITRPNDRYRGTHLEGRMSTMITTINLVSFLNMYTKRHATTAHILLPALMDKAVTAITEFSPSISHIFTDMNIGVHNERHERKI